MSEVMHNEKTVRKRKHVVSAHAHTHPHRPPDSRDETQLNPHQTQERNITDLRRGKKKKSWIRRVNMQLFKPKYWQKVGRKISQEYKEHLERKVNHWEVTQMLPVKYKSSALKPLKQMLDAREDFQRPDGSF